MKHIIILLLISTFSFAQDNSEKIVDVAYEACDCIGKIKTDLDKEQKAEEIKTCINSANIAYQINKSMVNTLEVVKDTLNKISTGTKIDSLAIQTEDLNIIISDSDYEEIEEYLYDTCGDMKAIYFSEDEESEKSFSDKEKAVDYYNKGLRAFDNQDYKKALSLYRKAVKEDKEFAFAWDNLGRTHRALGNYKEAVKSYKKSLKIDPKGRMPLTNIAVAYEFLKEYDKAKKAYRQFGKIYKDDPETYYGLGRIYILENDYENALDNIMHAYILYIEMKSPYKLDAEKLIGLLYKELQKNNKEAIFNRIAKKYKIQINEN